MEQMVRRGDEHYPADVVGATRDLPGAGILAWLTGDQLHPPMLDDDAMWGDGSAWADGARRYTVELGRMAAMAPDDHVLDIGCGACGPARSLVTTFGVRVTAITNSHAHVALSRSLNDRAALSGRIDVRYAERSEDWPGGGYDVAWSVNMLYQVPDHRLLYRRAADLLKPSGRIVLDDWMASDSVTEEDLSRFGHHFQYRNLVRLSEVEADLVRAGFYPASFVVDRGEAARGPMNRHFEAVMRTHFMPMLAQSWPDSAEGGISGRRLVLDFVDAVNLTLDLYRQGKLTYRTVVARKAPAGAR